MKLPNTSIDRILSVVEDVDLGDPRRAARLRKVMERMATKPSATLPDAMESEAELEGAYRLVNNEHVEFPDIFKAFAATTGERAKSVGSVLVIHDTTTAEFPHASPEEVGYLSTGKPGFFIHHALVLDGHEWRKPLGVANLETIVRRQRSKRGRRNKASGTETAQWKDRESARWERGVDAAAEVLANVSEVIHVADREGDSYAFLAALVTKGHSFVVRVNHDRRVGNPRKPETPWEPLTRQLTQLEGLLERDVAVSGRKPKSAPRASKAHPPRDARVARLTFTATSVMLKRPRYLRDPVPETLTLNVVHVVEPEPPSGEKAVEWMLFTTLRVNTPKEVARVVDIYRSRWTIEEFNKALKTGCAYESRELESLHGLLNLLAISLPIACELLWLRSRCRSDPDAPATTVLTETQLQVLRTMGARKLPKNPTVFDALWAVAGLGGHVSQNGFPGWLVLYRGMQTLLGYEVGYVAGLRAAAAASG